jgi:hypothetical protein
LVARPLAPAALRIRNKTSLKNTKWATKAKEWPTNSSLPKNIQKTFTKERAAYHWFLILVGFDTSDKEGIALAQSVHEGLQGLLEL